MLDPQEKLRLLARDDAAFIQAEITGDPHPQDGYALDPKTLALARLVALIALDAPDAAYGRSVREAIDAGAEHQELVEVLIALAPSVGVARVVAAAPRLAAAIGFSVDEAFAT
jgi:4-carboxymuconolactone decarboxylase